MGQFRLTNPPNRSLVETGSPAATQLASRM